MQVGGWYETETAVQLLLLKKTRQVISTHSSDFMNECWVLLGGAGTEFCHVSQLRALDYSSVDLPLRFTSESRSMDDFLHVQLSRCRWWWCRWRAPLHELKRKPHNTAISNQQSESQHNQSARRNVSVNCWCVHAVVGG